MIKIAISKVLGHSKDNFWKKEDIKYETYKRRFAKE